MWKEQNNSMQNTSVIDDNIWSLILNLEKAIHKLRSGSKWTMEEKAMNQIKPFLSSHESLLNYLNLTDDDVDYMMTLNLTFSNISIGGPARTTTKCYCSGAIRDVAKAYKGIHGYVSLLVCAFGTIANLLNVAVLTRKELCSAPINRILTGIAVADMLVMLEYVPFACYMYLLSANSSEFSYPGAVFILFHTHFSQVLHTISICLTLTLAIWRYIVIR